MREMCCSVCEWIDVADLAEQAGDVSPAPKIISVPIPFAIGARKTEPASASAGDDHDRAGDLESRRHDPVGQSSEPAQSVISTSAAK